MGTFKLLPAFQLNVIIKQMMNAKLPRCESRVVAEHRGRNNKHGDKCANFAKVEVDGRKLCVIHAKQHALAALMKKVKP